MKHLLRITVWLAMVLGVCAGAAAQTQNSITGTVVDNTNGPLAGVTVTSEFGEETALTDEEGRFEITLDEGEKLLFSLRGMQSALLPAKDGMNVILREGSTGKREGYLKMAVGHPQTYLDAQYKQTDERRNSLALRANHEAQWGLRTLEWSALALDYAHRLGDAEIYAKIGGAHLFFTRYGRYYDAEEQRCSLSRYSQLSHADKQGLWRATANIGVQSRGSRPLQYKTEAMLQTYTFQGMMTEYQANLRANIDYALGRGSRIGANNYFESHIVHLGDSAAAYYEEKHLTLTPSFSIRLEPYYAYRSERANIHLGVNLDFNIGKGNMLSHTTDETPLGRQIAFAPSPHVRLEVQLEPQKVMLFVDVLGSLGTSSMTGYVRLNPYINVMGAPSSHHVSSYIPADARLGVQIRPMKDLLIQLDGGYRHAYNQATISATEATDGSGLWNMMGILYTDFQRIKTGAEITYHYEDYLLMHLTCDYFFYTGISNNTSGRAVGALGKECCTKGRIYDRPSWEATARIEGHATERWSIYADGVLRGKRWAVTGTGDKQLPAFIDVSIGTAYGLGRLSEALRKAEIFAELQNILNRRNMVWYGYESNGIGGIVGVRLSLGS